LTCNTADTVFVVLSFSFQVWRYTDGCHVFAQHPFHCLPVSISSVCILSGDGGWQVRDVDVEEKGCQGRSEWDPLLEASQPDPFAISGGKGEAVIAGPRL